MIFYFLKELCRWTHPGHLYVFALLQGLTFHFVSAENRFQLLSLFSSLSPAFQLSTFSFFPFVLGLQR